MLLFKARNRLGSASGANPAASGFQVAKQNVALGMYRHAFPRYTYTKTRHEWRQSVGIG